MNIITITENCFYLNMQQVLKHGWHQVAGSICDFNSENTVLSCWQNNNIIQLLQCQGIWITWQCWKPITFNSASMHNFRVHKLSIAEPREIQNIYFASTVIIFHSITIACVVTCEPGCRTSTLLYSLGTDKGPYFWLWSCTNETLLHTEATDLLFIITFRPALQPTQPPI